MPEFYRVMLGRASKYAQQCLDGGFIGADFSIDEDLSHNLPENWRDFNQHYRPIYLSIYPDKSKISAGLACGALWTVSKGIKAGDVVLSPDGLGNYLVGEVASEYFWKENEILQHRRNVNWREERIPRSSMSQALANSAGSIATVAMISSHSEELERLIQGSPKPRIVSNDETIEDPSSFALEKHLEDFLVANWDQTALGKEFMIYEEEGEKVGRQFPSDTGPIDVLAISHDRKTLLVIELKRGRVSDVVVGQIQRYMGYVEEDIAEDHQEVKGMIIGHEDDLRLRRALQVTRNIEFYRYQVRFELIKED